MSNLMHKAKDTLTPGHNNQDGYATREGDNLNANTGVTGNTGQLREGEVIPNHHHHHNAGGVGNTNIGATGGGITGNQGVSGVGAGAGHLHGKSHGGIGQGGVQEMTESDHHEDSHENKEHSSSSHKKTVTGGGGF